MGNAWKLREFLRRMTNGEHKLTTLCGKALIVRFNDTSTLQDHFVSYEKGRKETEEIVREIKEGLRRKNRNESKEMK